MTMSNFINRFNPKRKVLNKAGDVILKRLNIGKEVTVENVTKACDNTLLQMNNNIVWCQYGIHKFRTDITNGMYDEVAKLIKTGMNQHQITDFYWNIPAFQKVWAKLQFEKINLEGLIDNVFNLPKP